MELYIHIPFCARKCRYCDFASYAGSEAFMPAYVDAVLDEAAYRANQLDAPTMDTVFLGGGTPSLLPARELDRLLGGIRKLFPLSQGAEFTSEANPGTLTDEWLNVAVKHGVNRLSMGMQAYQPALLNTLGRIHTFVDVQCSVEMARHAGISNISLDLMFGLPGQTAAQWRESLQAALSLKPQHMSCYGLIPEDGTPLKADLDVGCLALPDEETERIMYEDARTMLHDYGMEQYEISNFALPGYACRHNIGYWRQIPYLGLGAAASSMLPEGTACAYTRQTNPPRLNEYLSMISQVMWEQREVLAISKEEARFETLMLGLRTMEGVSSAGFAELHGVSLESCYGAKLEALRRQGLLEYADDFWRLTRRGMDVQNAILVDLMDE